MADASEQLRSGYRALEKLESEKAEPRRGPSRKERHRLGLISSVSDSILACAAEFSASTSIRDYADIRFTYHNIGLQTVDVAVIEGIVKVVN